MAKDFSTICIFCDISHLGEASRWGKAFAYSETFPSLLEFIWLLAGVGSLMRSELLAPTEAHSTFLAFIWLFPSVDDLMRNKV